MVEEIILDLLLLFYCLFVLKEDNVKLKGIQISKVRAIANTIPRRKILFFLILPLCVMLLLFLHGNRNILSIYIYTAVSLLVVFHALWLSVTQNNKYRALSFLFVTTIIVGRIVYPSILLHDIFVVLAVVWLGPFLTSFRFFTIKLFIAISIIWFCYDIFYVWATTGYQLVSNTTNTLGFPLSLVVGNTTLGLADLFFVSLLLSILKGFTYKVFAIVALTGSDLVLAYYVYHVQFLRVFPLLVLWVPLGLFVVLLEHRAHSKHMNRGLIAPDS
ncbi:MAG TPA: hypothetical protein VEW42_05880 [Candidatus Eisenbacteria bacterium]|nr:hypothetical protein [Candidatus Eisenbacteria bacterium]